MSFHADHAMLPAANDRMFYKTMRMILGDVMGVSGEDSLIVLFDSRTPIEIPRVYAGVASDLGAEVSLVEIPRPPSRKVFHLDLPKPIAAGLKTATKIIDSWISYTPVLADAVEAGIPMLYITPGPDAAEMLIRTVGEVDFEKMSRENAKIAELWTKEDELTITSDLGTDLKADISGIKVAPVRFPPAKPVKGKKWMTFTPWGYTGGAVNKVEGTMVVNGFTGSRGVGLIGIPMQPIKMTIKDNKIVETEGGGGGFWPLLKIHLDNFGDPTVWGFPAHGPSIGLNANCRIGGPAEWERVRGSIVFGIGDNSVLRRYQPASHGATEPGPYIKAPFHWDLQLLGANLYIGDTAVVENGQVKI